MRAWLAAMLGLSASMVAAGLAVTDDADRQVAQDEPARHSVSLAPHGTEALCAVGAGDHRSDYQAEAEKVQRLAELRGRYADRLARGLE